MWPFEMHWRWPATTFTTAIGRFSSTRAFSPTSRRQIAPNRPVVQCFQPPAVYLDVKRHIADNQEQLARLQEVKLSLHDYITKTFPLLEHHVYRTLLKHDPKLLEELAQD